MLVTSCSSPDCKGRQQSSAKKVLESDRQGSNSGYAVGCWTRAKSPWLYELSFTILVIVRVVSDQVCRVPDIKELLSKCWLVKKQMNRKGRCLETMSKEGGSQLHSSSMLQSGWEAGRKPLPETLPSWRTSLVARATKMIPSSSSFSVSELSLSSSSSDSTVRITAAAQGQELSGDGWLSSCLLVIHNPKPAPYPPGQTPFPHHHWQRCLLSPLAVSALA